MGLVKLCGFTVPADVEVACTLNPDFLGFVTEYPPSARSLSLRAATTLSGTSIVPVVSVVVNPSPSLLELISAEMRPFAIQLSGSETAEDVEGMRRLAGGIEIWKVIHVPENAQGATLDAVALDARAFDRAGAAKILVDAGSPSNPGGTGIRANVDVIPRLREVADLEIILAGGLTPDNVSDAIRQSRPDGVDVSSGVESVPGRKDAARMQQFVLRARAAF